MGYRAPPKNLYLVRANPGIDVGIRTTRKGADLLIEERKALKIIDEGPHYSIETYVRVQKT